MTMIDHFERLARNQREQRKGKYLAALAAVFVGAFALAAGGATAIALLLTIAEVVAP
jgi:hypothetical protein